MANMNLKLLVWRQGGLVRTPGRMVPYTAEDISPDMSFLEMLDVVNEGLIAKGEPPIVFDSDCREGICGMCSLVVNGVPHGPDRGSTVCQLHMRKFKDGDTITIEPWRAAAVPGAEGPRRRSRRVRHDSSPVGRLRVGEHRQRAGRQRDPDSEGHGRAAMDAAACIGCGACVAACKNASAALFVGAKISQLALLPQGHPERDQPRPGHGRRPWTSLGFGNCSNEAECEAVCPKEIPIANIARMRREYIRALLVGAR